MLIRFCFQMFKLKLYVFNLDEKWITWFIFVFWFAWVFLTRFIIKSNRFLSLISAGSIRVISWFLFWVFLTCWLASVLLSFCFLRFFRFLWWGFWNFWFWLGSFRDFIIILWSWFFCFVFTFCFTLFSFRFISFCLTFSLFLLFFPFSFFLFVFFFFLFK